MGPAALSTMSTLEFGLFQSALPLGTVTPGPNPTTWGLSSPAPLSYKKSLNEKYQKRVLQQAIRATRRSPMRRAPIMKGQKTKQVPVPTKVKVTYEASSSWSCPFIAMVSLTSSLYMLSGSSSTAGVTHLTKVSLIKMAYVSPNLPN